MKNILLVFLFIFSATIMVSGQDEILPKGNSEAEEAMLQWIDFIEPATMGIAITDPPPVPVRHMAEWEELEALVVTWRSFPAVLREIVRHAKEEVKVIILVRNENVRDEASFDLTSNGITLDNVEFLVVDNNSVWVRDYGQNTVYANEIEDRFFIDWVYNRIQRPEDDVTPEAVGDYLGTPVYSTTTGDYRMVNTGGNFMSDGLGTAFASELIFEENEAGNIFNAGPHDEAAIDGIMQEFMGIDRFIKFPTLPYDVIHHIDMHMHLADEETILWAEYPEGVADGPQIEANIAFLQDNHMSAFGTPYRIERIISPPASNGTYPNQGGDYRTYTNSVFVNGTILLPFYETQYDTIAQRIYEENFPGYKVVGINCNGMIWALGALHCITKEIGSDDPLWIVHQRQRDIEDNNSWAEYTISAQVRHAQGVTGATLYWTTNLDDGYEAIQMNNAGPVNENAWIASIPHQENGTTIYYYIHAEAENGKTQTRPLPAPEAYYPFTVNDMISSTKEVGATQMHDIYPNPANAVTVIPVEVPQATWAKVEVVDVTGKLMENVFDGVITAGENNLFIDAATYPSGTYLVKLTTESGVASQKLVVK